MKSFFSSLLIGSALLVTPAVTQAQLSSSLLKAVGVSDAALSDGLKSGLDSIIGQAISGENLKLTAPAALEKIQTLLSKTGKGSSSEGFNSALTDVAAKIAPQATTLIQSALKDVKIDDAKAVLSGGSDAATQLLKKSTAASLREKLLPLVKQATASTSMGAKAKEMLAAAGPLAGFGGSKAVSDLDGFLTDQVLDKSFALIGQQEAAVRANPSLLTDNPVAQKVFAMFKK